MSGIGCGSPLVRADPFHRPDRCQLAEQPVHGGAGQPGFLGQVAHPAHRPTHTRPLTARRRTRLRQDRSHRAHSGLPQCDSAQSGTRPPLPSCRPSSSASMCSKSARISVTDSLPRRHRKVDNQRGPGRRTVHRHRSAERVDSVSQAEQSGTPGEIGAADAVVGY